MSDQREDRCPNCSAPFEALTLYIDPAGPFYGCGECGWIEPHGPGVRTSELVAQLVAEAIAEAEHTEER